MANPLILAEKLALDLLDKKNKNRHLLSYTDRRLMFKPSLYLLTVAIRVAKKIGDEQRLERYIDAAIIFFPGNTLGYLEKAKMCLSRGSIHAAEVTLRKGPNAAAIKHAREVLRLRGDEALADPGIIAKDSVDLPQSAQVSTTKTRAVEGIDVLGSLYEQAVTSQAWEVLRREAARASKLFPFLSSGYYYQGAALEALGRMPEAIRVLEALPSVVMRDLNFQLLLAQLYRKQGNDIGALHVMMRAQMNHIRDRRVHFRIAELYRDDGDVDRAYMYTRVGERLSPQYGAVRRLSFEVDHELFQEGAETLERILAFSGAEMLRFLPMINRVSPFFPDSAEALQKARGKACKALWVAPFRSSHSLSRNVEIAIGCRWIQDARKLTAIGREKGLKLDTGTESWLKRVEKDLGGLGDILEIAWNNEHSDQLLGLEQGTPRQVDGAPFTQDKIVELFIPTSYFSKPAEEKPTYASVRGVFSTIADCLLERPELLVVPRLQLNWRYCKPRLSARTVSYHTRAQHADSRHLRVQESPLFGHCSLDNKGFAGFSSIAVDHAKIAAKVSELSSGALENNHREMFERFVKNNLSKYVQPENNQELPKSYVFVAMQIPTDVVAKLSWLDGIALLREVVDFYDGSDTKVVVKRHPYCGSMRVQRTIDELSSRGSIILTKNSIHSAISRAQAVFTVNSGVGLEALIHLKPVVVSGQCDYSYAASCVKSSEELRQVLEQGPTLDKRRAQELLYYYFQNYTVPVGDAAVIRRRIDTWLQEPARRLLDER